MTRGAGTLAAVCTATFLLLLNVTMPSVSLPAIAKDLGGSLTDSQWVINAYALTLATFLLTAGSLADKLGRRRVFLAGLIGFTLTSLLCALAPSPLFLNLVRAAQGVGAAILFATSLALIAYEFRGTGRARALGVWGGAVAVSVAVGPLVGGALTDALGWRSVFLVNAPVGLAALIIGSRLVAESRDPHAGRIDWAGLLVLGAALFSLVFGLSRANVAGWGSPATLGMLGAAAAALAAFVAIERRKEQPMLDPALFSKPAFSGAAIVALALHSSIISVFAVFLTLYLLTVLGYSPLETGLVLLPFALTGLMASTAVGRLSRVPVRAQLSAGLVLAGLGLVLMVGVDANSHWTDLLPGFLVGGAGLGMVNPPLAFAALSVVPPEQSGMASAVSNTCRQVGVATGIAGLGAIFQGRVEEGVVGLLSTTPEAGRAPALAELVASGKTEQALGVLAPPGRAVLARAAGEAFASGLNHILVVAAVIAFLGAVCALLLVRTRDLAPGAADQDAPVDAPATARA